MEWIIRLIMEIIAEVQKRDVENRKKKKKTQKNDLKSLEEWLSGGSSPETVEDAELEGPKKRETSLEAWLESFDEKKPPEIREKATHETKLVKEVPPDRLTDGSEELFEDVHDDIHEGVYHNVHQNAYQINKDKAAFYLPGQTPLEQMIWAQTVMGPCKAHRYKAVHL